VTHNTLDPEPTPAGALVVLPSHVIALILEKRFSHRPMSSVLHEPSSDRAEIVVHTLPRKAHLTTAILIFSLFSVTAMITVFFSTNATITKIVRAGKPMTNVPRRARPRVLD